MGMFTPRGGSAPAAADQPHEAQQQGQEAPDADKDAQVRRHERDLKRVKRQLDDIAKEQKAERETSAKDKAPAPAGPAAGARTAPDGVVLGT